MMTMPTTSEFRLREQLMQAEIATATVNTGVLKTRARLRILLVDDEESMHEMLGLALNSTEYVLLSATNVDQAKKVIASVHPPDIVITDAMMPGDSGFSLITSIKANPATADIPVILWTVLEQQNGAVMDASGKADITMSKPLDVPNLLDCLTRARLLLKPTLEASF